MIMDVVGGGGGGVGLPFAAKIIGDTEGPLDKNANRGYDFAELRDAHRGELMPNGRTGSATNIWETSAVFQEGFIAPGGGCLGSLFPEASTLIVEVERIISPTVVLIYPTLVKKTEPSNQVGFNYMFHCVRCSSLVDPPGGGGQAYNSETGRGKQRYQVIQNVPSEGTKRETY